MRIFPAIYFSFSCRINCVREDYIQTEDPPYRTFKHSIQKWHPEVMVKLIELCESWKKFMGKALSTGRVFRAFLRHHALSCDITRFFSWKSGPQLKKKARDIAKGAWYRKKEQKKACSFLLLLAPFFSCSFLLLFRLFQPKHPEKGQNTPNQKATSTCFVLRRPLFPFLLLTRTELSNSFLQPLPFFISLGKAYT